MTKHELVALAKKKGFESKFFYPYPYVYTPNEDLRYYLWLCEIEKWLQSNHDVFTEHYTGNVKDLFAESVIKGLKTLQDINNDETS